ncbi:hypothetical protein INR49_017795 [Caranx melampygus]|nr:hypothetical protein INR49_017795 [Caranx melampygus]
MGWGGGVTPNSVSSSSASSSSILPVGCYQGRQVTHIHTVCYNCRNGPGDCGLLLTHLTWPKFDEIKWIRT